ncbi:MAG TPA: 4,5-DOPA dioxygenase extradiol [Bacteroidota bacterium]|nr:4,5-DOPA dioxygenase extradiol [Bacteroidota bacterium]
MELSDLKNLTSSLGETQPMPLLFVGHGNPMNAITDNEFSRGWREAGKSLPRPSVILCVSAHWETRGTFVTAMEKPQTIHDFGGFPPELYRVEYPAPGSPAFAEQTKGAIRTAEVGLDYEWGLDHGCWSVLRHLFPAAGVPVIQLSLDRTKPPGWHFGLAKELSPFRRKGVLVVGSGNMVHNLGMIDWNATDGFGWAREANDQLKKMIEGNESGRLIDYASLSREIQMGVPTPEHYIPLLYALGLREEGEDLSFFNDRTELGAISMTSFRIG